MRELSVAEQRYRAVFAVISDGRTVTDVAAAAGMSRQTLHSWLGRYEADGLEGLGDRSHRPHVSPSDAASGGGGGVGGPPEPSVVGSAADCGRAGPARCDDEQVGDVSLPAAVRAGGA